MIGSTRQVRVFAYSAPADMRKGFDGLSGLVAEKLGQDVLSGDVFLFVARNRRRARVIFWDGTGLCIFAKRLERGRFAAPWERGAGETLRMTVSELALLLEGSELIGKVPLSPPAFLDHAAPLS